MTEKLKPVIEYHWNGKVKRAYTTDENGKEQGAFEEYYENGQLSRRMNYKKGSRNG